MELKKCSQCDKLLDRSLFGKRTSSKDGLRPECKICQSISKKKSRKPYSEYTEEEKIKHRESTAKYDKSHKKEKSESHKEWYKDKGFDNYKENKLKDLDDRLIKYFKDKYNIDLLPNIVEFKSHIEKQFESWMSWKNWRINVLIWDDNDPKTHGWKIINNCNNILDLEKIKIISTK